MASREWIRFNDDSRAVGNRQRHIAAHGGEFVKGAKGWEWVNTKPATKPAPVKKTVQTTTKKKKIK